MLAFSASSQPLPTISTWIILLIAASLAIMVLFPVEIFQGEIYLLNAIVLSAGLLFGLIHTGIAIIAGVFIGFLLIKLYLAIQHRSGTRRTAKQNFWSRAGFLTGSLLIPLAVTVYFLGILSPAYPSNGINQSLIISIFLAGLLFTFLHAGLVLGESLIDRGKASLWQVNDLLSFLFVEFLPIPVGLLSILALPLGETRIIFILVGSTMISVAVVANRLSVPRSLLERRARELSTLNQISRTLSSSLDLDKLLESIQLQVTQVLNVDNFYVALYDSGNQQIWYPLAVKNGQRQVWSRRPLADRLTDRVIQLREPILLPHHARQELARIGLPPSEDAPNAWVGVPLVTSERVIGCMAVFSLSADTEFTKADLNLLTILAGQASVAIEIALHNALLSSDVTIGRDRLSAVLNSVNEGILLIEENGRVTLANEAAAQITHIPQSDFIGRRLPELTTPVLQALGFTPQLAYSLLHQIEVPPDIIESPFIFHLAERVPPQIIERTLVPVASMPGKITGWLMILRDITEEQQVQEARDLISETLVHDLRSPIGAVLAALDVVTESIESDGHKEIIRSSVNIAQRSARRVLELVESMLEIARLQAGNFSLDLEPVALKPLISHTLLDFNIQASDYGITLHNNLPENLTAVFIDSGKIQRVFHNLIDNALKFTPERGRVCLEASEVDNQAILIRVVDNGPGIPEEYREKIFERFSQVPGKTARRRGSGLGLAYCRLAVEAHGGKIWVEPNHPHGSIFCFTLPLAGQRDNIED
jgi:two-component system, NtrC family, sensor histidine kinase KinB